MPRPARNPSGRSAVPRRPLPSLPAAHRPEPPDARRAPRPASRAGAAALAFACAVALGCGKKGPPLAPIQHVPAAVDKIAVQRLGHDVYLTLTVPSQNIDATTPADIARIDVYAVTAIAQPPRARFLEVADRVATIPVARVPGAAGMDAGGAADQNTGGAVQGAAVTVRDTLTAEQYVPTTLPPLAAMAGRGAGAPADAARDPRSTGAPGDQPPAGRASPAANVPRRFYMALGFSDRNRPGPPGTFAELPLTPVPEPPVDVQAVYTADSVLVSWQPAGGLLGFLLDRPLPIEISPVDGTLPAPAADSEGNLAEVPAGPTRFHVYRELAPDPLELPAVGGATASPASSAAVPVPLTVQPIDPLMLRDDVAFERERCYSVSAVRGAPPRQVEGEASAPLCIRPIDIFPPAPPSGVTAVAAERVISLIWQPNTEPDLDGYLILRGRAGDATLQPLIETPVAEARYTDRTVTAGVRYIYAVVAVDSRLPLPNVSEASARVEETAR